MVIELVGRRQSVLFLIEATETETGIEASGYLANQTLKKGRILKHNGKRYKLPVTFNEGIFCMDGEEKWQLSAKIQLTSL